MSGKRAKKADLTLVIASREEAHLDATIESARATAGVKLDVVVVFDGGTEAEASASSADHCVVFKAPRGVGAARHAGIQRAATDLVVLADAHMVFQPNWGQAFLTHFRDKANRCDVVCGKMKAMAAYGAIEEGVPYTGARMVNRARSELGEHVVLTAVWHRQSPGPIGAIMGAFYGFRKDWYVKIGEPLAPLVGWGMDEEMLSIGSWICGGRVQLIDVWAAHLMKTNATVNYVPEPEHIYRVWLNRFRIARAVPASDEVREEWNMWLTLNPIGHTARFKELWAADQVRPETARVLAAWSECGENWKDYSARWLDPHPRMGSPRFVATGANAIRDRVSAVEQNGDLPPAIPLSLAAQAPRVQVINLPVCPNCGAKNSARWYSVKEDAGGVRRYGRCNVVECRLPVVMVERNGTRRYLWGKDATLAD